MVPGGVAVSYERGTSAVSHISISGTVRQVKVAAILCAGGPDVIRKEAWSFYRTISGVRLCWQLEEREGPKGLVSRWQEPKGPNGLATTSGTMWQANLQRVSGRLASATTRCSAAIREAKGGGLGRRRACTWAPSGVHPGL